MLILSFFCIPLVPLLMLILPTCLTLYWIIACDADISFSSDTYYRPSMQVLFEELVEEGKFSYFCIKTYRCRCLRGRDYPAFFVALLIFTLFTIPLFTIAAAVFTILALILGTTIILLALICYQSRMLKTLTSLMFF